MAARGRTTAMAATIALAAALGAPAGAPGQAAPEIAGPAGTDSGGPPPCRPSRTRICAKGDLAPALAARGLLTTTARRGLGVRSGAALAGQRAAKRANARLVAALGGPLPAAPARSAQAGAPTIADSVEERTTIRRGRAREARRFSWRAKVERCPDPGPPTNTHGRAKLQAGAIFEVVNDEPRKDVIVRTITRMETKLDTSIASDNRASLDFVGEIGKANDITVTQSVLVIRNGNSRRAGRMAVIEMTSQILAPDLDIQLKSDGFDAFIERMEAQEKGEPTPGADGPIVGQAWKNAVRDFMKLVAARATQLAEAAERHWRTPNRCFGFALDGPSKIRPGARVELTGKATPGERGGSARGILGSGGGSGTWTTARAPRGKSIESLVSSLPLPEDKPWIAFTAPGQRWAKGAEPYVDMVLATKAGIGSTTKSFEEGLPDRFTGFLTVDQTLSIITTKFTSRLEYALVSDKTVPDGTRMGLYELRTASLDAFSERLANGCDHLGQTSGPAIVRFGDLEVDISPQGAVTYGFVQDLGRDGVPYAPQNPVPGCTGYTTLSVAFFNARAADNGLRPGPEDLRFVQGPTSEAAGFGNGATGTASWELLPG